MFKALLCSFVLFAAACSRSEELLAGSAHAESLPQPSDQAIPHADAGVASDAGVPRGADGGVAGDAGVGRVTDAGASPGDAGAGSGRPPGPNVPTPPPSGPRPTPSPTPTPGTPTR